MTISRQLGTAELLYRRAKQMGLQPSWVTPNGMFAIATVDGEKYINSTFSSLNSHVGASLAKDKYLTRLIMERSNLPNIPFARPETPAQAQAFLEEHGTIIVKPVDGAGSKDIHMVTHMDDLNGIDIRKYIFEKYILGQEIRYLVLADEVIGVYESEYGTSVEVTRPRRGITYPPNEWDPVLIELSKRIARTIGLKFAAVDYLIDAEGGVHILEVNTSPDLKWCHAPSSGSPIDIATPFIQAMLDDMQNQTLRLTRDDGLGILSARGV
jgi:glutathione synthase/RimK-type ligase-like ATP-grasp enzyme